MKVAIGFPSRDMVHAAWTLDLVQLVGRSMADGIKLGAFNAEGTLICDQRVMLAQRAIESNADAILWLDTDMRFPKDALIRLLAHDKPIVAANYVTRSVPPSPTARNYRDGQWWKVPTYRDSTGLEEVWAAGMGVMLVRTEVFKELNQPWFHIGYAKDGQIVGEDVHFCVHAKDKGFQTWIDHDLSKEVRHLGLVEFAHENFHLWDKEPAAIAANPKSEAA
jgi:hypothetical protein